MLDGDETNHRAVYTPPFDMRAVSSFYVWVDYTASATRLDVFVSQSSTKPGAAQLSYVSRCPSGMNMCEQVNYYRVCTAPPANNGCSCNVPGAGASADAAAIAAALFLSLRRRRRKPE